MNIVQVILIAAGALIAVGGVLMLVRGSGGPESSPRRAYTPIGMIFLGGLIAYRSFAEFSTMDEQDLLITSLFVVALLSLLGLQFFVADKHARNVEPIPPGQDRAERTDPEGSD